MATTTKLQKLDKQTLNLQSQLPKTAKNAKQVALQSIVELALKVGLSPKDVMDAVTNATKKGIDATDDGTASKRGRRPLPVTKAQKMSQPRRNVVAKYRSPDGKEWSGRGPMPRWLAELSEADRKRCLVEVLSK